jgi:hypothetical protein
VPYIKVGGVILFPLDSLRDWLRKQAEGDEKKNRRRYLTLMSHDGSKSLAFRRKL